MKVRAAERHHLEWIAQYVQLAELRWWPGRWVVYQCGACNTLRAYAYIPQQPEGISMSWPVMVFYFRAEEWCEYCENVVAEIGEHITTDEPWPTPPASTIDGGLTSA